MGNGTSRLSELGFSEFVSLLVTETLDAVIASLQEQEKRVVELQQSLFYTPAEFGKRYLTDEIVRAEILRLFPSPEGTEGKSAVDAGASYQPAREKQNEVPPIFEMTGYRMAKGDWEKLIKEIVITQKGYENIANAVRESLASSQIESLRVLTARGLPRVYVDNGHIKAKLNFRLEEQENKTSSKSASLINKPVGGRLFIQPINTRGPEFLTLKADVTSEVEVTFKTIVP